MYDSKLVDDASHELRTPLAVIRTNVDAVLSRADAPEQERQRAVAVVDRAVERMTRLVEDLLASARSASRCCHSRAGRGSGSGGRRVVGAGA